jgi:large repetitive protein
MATATNLSGGTYEVTVTDANGCTATASVTIAEPSNALALNGTQINPTCNGDANGSIDITVTGGTEPYSYSWSNGYNGEDPTGLTAGTYTIIVTDANGCTVTDIFTLTEPDALVLDVDDIVNTQCNASVGEVTLVRASNTLRVPFTLGTVTQTGTTATFTGLAAGYYTAYFEATATGCTAEVGFNIANDNSDLAATVSVTDPQCYGGTVTATVTATGGTPDYTYSSQRRHSPDKRRICRLNSRRLQRTGN